MTLKNLSVLPAVAALLIAGCTAGGRGDVAGVTNARPGSAETAAMVATYRYLFANNASSLQGRAATYCVGIGSGRDLADPASEVIGALSDVTPRVRPASTCKVQVRAVDAEGSPSVIFNLSPMGCSDAANCLFNGGYYEGNVSGSGGNYHARLVEGAWQVQPEGPQAVS